MRRVSLKRQRENRAAKVVRDGLAADFPICMLCRRRDGTDTHEISRGAARGVSLGVRAALLRLCRGCHDLVQTWPVATQLAVKGLRDAEYFDRVEVNRLRGRADDSITEREVWEQLPWVLKQRP